MSAQASSSRKKFVRFSERLPKQTRERRIMFGDAEIVVAWLKRMKGTAAYRRVLDIQEELTYLGSTLGDLRENLDLGSTLDVQELARKVAEQPRDLSQRLVAFRKRHNALNRRLARYALVPALAYDPQMGLWHYSALPKRIRGPVVKIRIETNTPIQGMTAPLVVCEASVVSALARLASQKEIGKVRLCEQCHDSWFVSQREIDRFCSGACRKDFHAESEEGKRRHREAQQRYRANLRASH